MGAPTIGADRAPVGGMTEHELSNLELAFLARAGDEAALDEIYRRFTPIVTAIARRVLRRSNDIEDVVQETFLIVLEKLWQLEESAALRGWICRIALHCAHRRLRCRWTLEREDATVLEQHASHDASPEQRAELALIVRALGLPAELRAPWILRHVIGARLDDIALACGCSLATTKRRLARADAIVVAFVTNDAPLQRGPANFNAPQEVS